MQWWERPIRFELVAGTRATLGESPAWSAAEGCLWWVDIDGRRLWRYAPSSGRAESWATPELPGFVVMTDRGPPAVGMESGIFLFEAATGRFERLVELAQQGVRFNDATVDDAGRLWAGTMALGAPQPLGVLYAAGADLALKPLVDGLFTPNGLAGDSARNRLYLSDSNVGVQSIWHYDLALSGEPRLADRRPFAGLHELPGRPDGAALDAEGNYLIAGVGGGKALHLFDPSGAHLASIPTPFDDPTKAGFDNAGETLYLTSKFGELAVARLESAVGPPLPAWRIGG